MNTVKHIKYVANEGRLTEAHRTELKKLGPPRPEMVITQETPDKRFPKVYFEKFSFELYNVADWLCGCSVQNALFCYICLVMGNANIISKDSYYWVNFGVTTEITTKEKLLKKVNQHQTTTEHMKNSLEYALLGENNVLHYLRNEFLLTVTQHNEKVRPNRYILSKLIDCVKYASGESDYQAEMTQVLKDNATLATGVCSDSFQIILDAIHAVCVNLIHTEIRRTDFMSLEVDEVNSVGSLVKLVFIVRYELQGEIHERFLKYTVTQSNHSLNVCSIILAELNNLATINQKHENMISFSYDGLISVFAARWGLHSKIKNHFKRIHFIHSYAHSIDFVIEHTGSLFKELGIFLINLKTFREFFSSSEKYITTLDTVVSRRLNGEFKTEWNFQATSPTVITLCSHKSDINECLDQIIDDEVHRSTIAEAVALKNLLNDEDFNYWLDFFAKVMPVCDELFYEIQQLKAFDAAQVRTIVENFKTEMNYVKSGLSRGVEVNPPPNKKPCVEQIFIKEEADPISNVVVQAPPTDALQAPPTHDLNEVARTAKADQVFDVIMAYVEERVMPSPFLLLASLIHPNFFNVYRLAFPRAEVEQAAKIFSLDKDALVGELQIIYNRDELTQAEGALFLLQYLYENRITDMFPEVFKLLKMVCTVPMTTSEPGRCFDTLNQIKSFLKSSSEQKKCDVLTMCLVEKDLMKRTPNFNELVIEQFCQGKRGGVDISGFTYKQLY